MSVYMYDDAIVENLRHIMKNPSIYITPVENVFRVIAKMNEDEIKFPLISLTRTGWGLHDVSFSQKHEGKGEKWDEYNHKVKSLQFMPIKIDYQLDVWTTSRLENDDIVREILFYYNTHPTMLINIDYGIDKDHTFNIYFDGEVQDNSDINSHVEKGEFFRQTLKFYTDDAYLWKSSSRKPTVVVPEIWVAPSRTRIPKDLLIKTNFSIDGYYDEEK